MINWKPNLLHHNRCNNKQQQQQQHQSQQPISINGRAFLYNSCSQRGKIISGPATSCSYVPHVETAMTVCFTGIQAAHGKLIRSNDFVWSSNRQNVHLFRLLCLIHKMIYARFCCHFPNDVNPRTETRIARASSCRNSFTIDSCAKCLQPSNNALQIMLISSVVNAYTEVDTILLMAFERNVMSTRKQKLFSSRERILSRCSPQLTVSCVRTMPPYCTMSSTSLSAPNISYASRQRNVARLLRAASSASASRVVSAWVSSQCLLLAVCW